MNDLSLMQQIQYLLEWPDLPLRMAIAMALALAIAMAYRFLIHRRERRSAFYQVH